MRAPPPPPPRKNKTYSEVASVVEVMPTTRRFRTKLEPWMAKVVGAAIKQAQPLSTTAGLIGVTKATLIRWRQEGLEEGCPDPLKVELAVIIEEARSEAIQAGMETMQLHAAEDWRAQAEILRALDPDTFSPQHRSKVEVEVKEVKRSLKHLSDAEVLELERLEAKAYKSLPSGD